MKTHVEPMGHNIKLFSAACLQIEPSLHSSFCFIVRFIPAIDRIHSRYFLQMQFLVTAQIKTIRSIVTGGDGTAFMTAIKGTNYFRNSLK